MYCHTTECCKLQVPSKTGTSPSPPFPPRGLGAFGEIIDESPGMQGGNEHHTQPHKRSLTSVCTSKQQTGGECTCLFACTTVCAYVRVYQRRRVIILFFLRHNPFLLSLREHRGVMRDEPERGWRQFWGRPVLFVFFFSFLFLDATLSFHSSISSCETPPVLL